MNSATQLFYERGERVHAENSRRRNPDGSLSFNLHLNKLPHWTDVQIEPQREWIGLKPSSESLVAQSKPGPPESHYKYHHKDNKRIQRREEKKLQVKKGKAEEGKFSKGEKGIKE